MTVKSLLVKIGADTTELQAGLTKSEAFLKSHEARFLKIGAAMTAVGGIMTAFFGKAVQAAAQQEAAEARLENALNNVKGATEGGAAMLIQYATALQKVTGYGDEEIVSAQAMLATFQLNERQIAAITPRLLDMAAATEKATGQKQDLQAIAIALGKGFTGMAGSLSRYGVVLSDETKKTGDFNAILNDLDMNFKGAAETMGRTFTGQLRIMKASLGEVAEGIGAKLIPALLPFIEKITKAGEGMQRWIETHQGLVRTLVPIFAGLAAIMTVLGPMVMILPKLVGGIMAVGKAFVFLATNPLGLVIAALGTAAYMFLKVKDAQLQAEESARRADAAEAKLKEKLWLAAEAAGMTRDAFEKLTQKYEGNIAAMAMAIKHGKESVEMQTSLATVGKAHAAAIEEQKRALEGQANAQFRTTQAAEEAQKQLETIIGLRKQMTDEVAKATMKEREYQKFALEQAYAERKAQIEKEITDEKTKGALLLQAKTSHEAQMAALEKTFRDQDLQARIDFAQQIADQEDAQTMARIEAAKAFVEQKRELKDAVNQLTMSELEYKRWALEEERIAEEARIQNSKELSAAQKEDLLAQLETYYAEKKAQDERDASGWTELLKNTTETLSGLFEGFLTGTLDAFQKWGEEGGSILETLGGAFKSLVSDALGALKNLVVGMLTSAAKEILAAQAVTIAHTIESVMTSIPFPLNLALVGGAIAAVSALFRKIKLGEGGIVTGPTLAMIGERGPEAVIPLDRAGVLGMAGAGVTLRQNNYFYGSINNAGDLDEISRRLAERMTQAISKGRR